MTIVFAKTRHRYDSYSDFWRLVDAAGFATCYIDEIDANDGRTYIFSPMNGEALHRIDDFAVGSSRIIWWNLERPEDDTLEASIARVASKLDAIWVSDRGFATKSPYFTYVPVAGHPNFGKRSIEKRWDVCHLAYLWGRRQDAINQLGARGISIAPEAWGRAQQDEVVAKSRVMLNMHQYDGMTIVAPIRFAVAASYAIPIISERFDDALSSDLVIHQSDTVPSLIDYAEMAIRDHQPYLESAGEKLFQRLCVQTNFRREVELATDKKAT